MLQGRTNELRFLQSHIDIGSSVLLIWGERGVGKTALARQVFESERKGLRYEAVVSISALMRDWDQVLSELHRRLSLTHVVGNSMLILDAVVDELVGTPILLLLDNIETELMNQGFASFLERLCLTECRSLVIVTTTTEMTPAYTHAGVLALKGLSDESAIMTILGEELGARFPRSLLLNAANELGGNPQRLVYLRWNDPIDATELWERVEGMRQAGGALSNAGALRSMLREDRVDSLRYATALGRFNTGMFPRDFLQAIWESLFDPGGFESSLEVLVGRGVLIPQSGGEYRIHPNVHSDLSKLAEGEGFKWLNSVHEAAKNLYASRLNDDEWLREWVFHKLQLGEWREAFRTAMDAMRLEDVHCGGRALNYKPVVDALRNAGREQFGELDYAAILIEMAAINGDLSRHEECLSNIDEALGVLRRVDGTETLPLRRKAMMLKAIAAGDLGNTSLCIDSYLTVLKLDEDAVDPNTALCMGYLGYVYCDLLEFEKADTYTKHALTLVPPAPHTLIHAKNLSNRGLYLFYRGNIEAAISCFERALLMVDGTKSGFRDVREQGRVLSHLAVARLSEPGGALDRAETELLKSLSITHSAGDARRGAITLGRLGLLELRRGNYGESKRRLMDALVTHRRLGDVRNMIFEALFLAGVCQSEDGMQIGSAIDEFVKASLQRGHFGPEISNAIVGAFSHERYRHLLTFWWTCQRPAFFG